jgi:hypothetical protein
VAVGPFTVFVLFAAAPAAVSAAAVAAAFMLKFVLGLRFGSSAFM